MGAMIAIMNDGSFDIMIGCYLHSKINEVLTGLELVSYTMGQIMLVIVAFGMTSLIVWIQFLGKKDLQSKEYIEIYSTLYEELKEDKLFYTLF
jgi:hypothetical protein